MHYHVDRIKNLTKQVRAMNDTVFTVLEFLRGPVPQDPKGKDGLQPSPQGVINELGDGITWLDNELCLMNDQLNNLRAVLDMNPPENLIASAGNSLGLKGRDYI